MTGHFHCALLAITSVCMSRLPRRSSKRARRLCHAALAARLLHFARVAHAVESALRARVLLCKGGLVLPCFAYAALPRRVVCRMVTHAFSAHPRGCFPFPLPCSVPAFGLAFAALAARFFFSVAPAYRCPIDAVPTPGLQQQSPLSEFEGHLQHVRLATFTRRCHSRPRRARLEDR